MGKLSHLKPALSNLGPLLTRQTDAEGHSVAAEPWRRWYSLARWKRLRIEVFTRDLFTCQMSACGRLEGNTSLLVCDHVEPHRGDERLFWDVENLQTLCKPCHDRAKQADERRASGPGSGVVAGAGGGSGRMSRPEWFRRVCVPLTIVCGPPGAGKSTYVRAHAGPRDRVICFDELAFTRLGNGEGQRAPAELSLGQIADVLRVRNEALGDLMRPVAAARWTGAWLILTEPKAAHREWWARTLGARVLVLATPADECSRRIAADEAAGDVRGGSARELVHTWWRQYRPAACDEVIA